jgi:hypothetical protein
MTIKASGRALLAIGLLLGLASVSQAASGDNVWPQVPQATSSTMQPRTDAVVVASDQLNAADRAVSEPAQTVQSTTVSPPTSQPDTQSVVPVVASGGEGSPWDKADLIGKIFIGFGTLLTLGSAARMLMA